MTGGIIYKNIVSPLADSRNSTLEKSFLGAGQAWFPGQEYLLLREQTGLSAFLRCFPNFCWARPGWASSHLTCSCGACFRLAWSVLLGAMAPLLHSPKPWGPWLFLFPPKDAPTPFPRNFLPAIEREGYRNLSSPFCYHPWEKKNQSTHTITLAPWGDTRSWNPGSHGLTHFCSGLKGPLHLKNHPEKGVPFSEALPAWTPQAECQQACQLDKAKARTRLALEVLLPMSSHWHLIMYREVGQTLQELPLPSSGCHMEASFPKDSTRPQAGTQQWGQWPRPGHKTWGAAKRGGGMSRVSADIRTHLPGCPRQDLFNVEWQFDRINSVGDEWRQKHPSFTRATSRFLVSGTAMVLQAP